MNVVSKNPFEETTRTNFNHVKTEKLGQKAGTEYYCKLYLRPKLMWGFAWLTSMKCHMPQQRRHYIVALHCHISFTKPFTKKQIHMLDKHFWKYVDELPPHKGDDMEYGESKNQMKLGIQGNIWWIESSFHCEDLCSVFKATSIDGRDRDAYETKFSSPKDILHSKLSSQKTYSQGKIDF